MTLPLSSLGRAHLRAERLYPRSKGFRRAYVAGAFAALEGRPASVCPYAKRAGTDWGSAWRTAWMRGHRSAAPIEGES